MAKYNAWHDDYWLLLMQVYLKEPVGMKPLYNRDMVNLSLELHITPRVLRNRMQRIAGLETPRIERIWSAYKDAPKRLERAVRLLRSMKGFGAADEFYEGVEVQETFETEFRPIAPTASGTKPSAPEQRLTPAMLVMVLHLYFQLTPATMVAKTPEVQQMARMLQIKSSDVVEVLTVYQCCDPYLHRANVVFSPLLGPCQQVWQRFADNAKQLADYVEELQVYFKS